MTPDQLLYRLNIEIKGPLADFCHIIVFNGFNEIVVKQYGNAELSLPKGLYRVRLELNEEKIEDMVRLDKDSSLTMEPPPTYSSIVAHEYSSSHEYYTHDATHWSIEPTTSETGGGNEGSIFIFFRYPSHEVRQNMALGQESLGKNFYLLNDQRELLFPFSGKNIRENMETGWLAFHAPVKNGQYYLHYDGEKKREIPLYVFNGWQLQIFLTFRGEPLFGSLRIATERKETGFTNMSPVNYIMDASLQKLHNGIYFLPEKVLQNMGAGNWENPLIGLLAAYIYFKSGKKDKDDLFRGLLENFDKIITEDENAPDLIALKILAAKYFNQPVGPLQLSAPCMFITGMRVAIELSVENIDVVQDDSLAENAIETLYNDIVWTSYYPPPFLGPVARQAPAYLSRGIALPNRQEIAPSEPLPTSPPDIQTAGTVPENNNDSNAGSWVAESIISEVSSLSAGSNISVSDLAERLQVTPNIINKTIHNILSNEPAAASKSMNGSDPRMNELLNNHVMDKLKSITNPDIGKSRTSAPDTRDAATTSSLDKLYYVNVGPGGTFKPSGDPMYDSTPADVDRIFENLQEKNTKHIALYFHGGLTNLKTGIRTAEYFTGLNVGKTSIHPVSFLWETGLVETLKENLISVHSNNLFKKLLEKVIKVAGEKLGIDVESGVGKRGVASLSSNEIQSELNTEAPFEEYSVDPASRSASVQTYNEDLLKAEVEEELEIEIDIDGELQQELKKEKSNEEIKFVNTSQLNDVQTEGARGIFQTVKLVKSLATVVLNVVKRHINKRDHGFFPTVVEELMRELYVASLGAWIWSSMKKKAAAMWQDDAPKTSGTDQHAGSYFMEKLHQYTAGNKDVTIDLIGHSAGSIVICHFMQRLSSQNYTLPIRNIIFMAPACTSQLFSASIIANQKLFSGFRMFTMDDTYEKTDRLVPYIYTRSLLYLVSGALEDDGKSYDSYILGMRRYINETPPFDNDPLLSQVRDFLKAGENRIIYSVTGDDALPGLVTTSLKHGDFDNIGEKTMESIIHMINQ